MKTVAFEKDKNTYTIIGIPCVNEELKDDKGHLHNSIEIIPAPMGQL